jgi:hypothetical protein
MSLRGMLWSWMFWRVVMWPFFQGARSRAMLAEARRGGGAEDPARELDPQHVDVLLPLPVDAAGEAEGAKVLGGQLAALKGLEHADKLLDVLGASIVGVVTGFLHEVSLFID